MLTLLQLVHDSCNMNQIALVNECTVSKTLQAMPQLTDRSKLPKIVDPVIKDTMDHKHLYQVCIIFSLVYALKSY